MEGGLGGWGTPPDFVIVGSLSNNDGNDYKNITSKVIHSASNFTSLIPSRSIQQIMVNFAGVEF